MALSSSLSSPAITISSLHFSANPPNLKIPTFNFHLSSIPINGDNRNPLLVTKTRSDDKWRARVSFFPVFLRKKKDANLLKEELLNAIAPLDRGADATVEDQQRVDEIATQLEAVNPTKEPLKSNLLNGKWELIYTTSQSILQTKFALQISKFMRSRTNYQAINVDTLRAQNMDSWPFFDKRPKLLRSRTNYQAINVDTLRAQNMESWPFFNQVTADLTPLSAKKVAVQFDTFKILGLIPIKAPGRARGELETTYLDEELRISRGDKGNLFVLKMINPSYRVPV